jgi:hypothetical protein
MILVVGLESLQVVSLLGVLPLVINTGIGGVVALRWGGGTVHGLPFVALVLLQLETVGSLVVVTMVVFVEVALIRGMFWIVLTPLWSKWPSTGFTLFTSRNVNIYDVLVVMFRLFIMEVVSTVTNFVTSSQITSDATKPLKIMTKLT